MPIDVVCDRCQQHLSYCRHRCWGCRRRVCLDCRRQLRNGSYDSECIECLFRRRPKLVPEQYLEGLRARAEADAAARTEEAARAEALDTARASGSTWPVSHRQVFPDGTIGTISFERANNRWRATTSFPYTDARGYGQRRKTWSFASTRAGAEARLAEAQAAHALAEAQRAAKRSRAQQDKVGLLRMLLAHAEAQQAVALADTSAT